MGYICVMKKVLAHFEKVDPVLHKAALQVGLFELDFYNKRQNHFENLCREITNQQLSNKAGDTIFGRFKKLFPKEIPEPELVLKFDDQTIRDVGMSWAKVRYVKDLADKVLKKEVDIENLDKLSDEEVMSELTKVKGIGPWTVEMYLMFTLGRPDVFSLGDLGLKRAIQKLYGMKKEPTKKQMEQMSKKWSPYRTYAA